MFTIIKHFDKERILILAENLTPKQTKALRDGEIFVLCGKDGKPYYEILMAV